MPLPMIGTWTVVLNGMKPFSIHGDAYFELHVTNVEDQTDHLVRVPEHAIAAPVTPGDRLTLSFLMGQVTEVKK